MISRRLPGTNLRFPLRPDAAVPRNPNKSAGGCSYTASQNPSLARYLLTDINWLTAVIAFPIGFAGTLLVRGLAIRRDWLVPTGPGRIHRRPVPQLGGVAILAGFMAAVLVAVPMDSRVLGLMLGAVVVVIIALADDFRDLSPRDKLIGQLLAAAIPLAFGIRIDGVSNPFGGLLILPLVLAIPFTLFWTTGMMNAINFLDGVDGLADGVAAIATAILVTLSVQLGQPLVATVGIALIAAALGFLPFNLFRASIFLGDSGAHLLGYVIAVLAIMGGAKIATALLVLGIPILDVAWAVIRRWRAGGRVAGRDTDHLHHRLLRAGLPQPAVVFAYYTVSAGFGLIALYLHKYEKLVALGVLGVLMVVVLLVLARTDLGETASG